MLRADHPREAAAAFLEGAAALRPLYDALPQSFAGLFQALVRDYFAAAQAANLPLEQVETALAELGVQHSGFDENP